MVSITSYDYSALFNIVTWVLVATIILLVAFKLVLSYSAFALHSDDWSIIVATLLSIGQTCAASVSAFNGLGRHQASVSAQELNVYEKSTYAGNFLYIASLAASKISVLLFIWLLTTDGPRRKVAVVSGIFTVLWILASLLVNAFQCSDPHEWSILSGSCINQAAFWTSFAAINIVTELPLIILPIHVIYYLRTSVCTRLVLIICFGLRLSVIAAIAVQIWLLYAPPNITPPTTHTDLTFTTWPYQLATQVVQALSIITVCIPQVKTLLAGLESGFWQTGRFSVSSFSSSGKGSKSGKGSISASGPMITPTAAARRAMLQQRSPTGSGDGVMFREPGWGSGSASGQQTLVSSEGITRRDFSDDANMAGNMAMAMDAVMSGGSGEIERRDRSESEVRRLESLRFGQEDAMADLRPYMV